MKVLCNDNGRLTFSLSVVSTKPNTPCPDFLVASMTKLMADNVTQLIHIAKSDKSKKDHPTAFDVRYGPIEDHKLHLEGRWYHGDMENESAWVRVFDVEESQFVFSIDSTVFYKCKHDGIEYETERVKLDDIIMQMASFYNSGSILEKLEERAANNGLYGHDYWMIRDEYKVIQ